VNTQDTPGLPGPDLRDSMLDGYIRQRPPEHRPLFALFAPGDRLRPAKPRRWWLSLCASVLTNDWEYVYTQHEILRRERLQREEARGD